MGIEGVYLNIIKAICDKTTAGIILKRQSTSVTLKIGKKTEMSAFTFYST